MQYYINIYNINLYKNMDINIHSNILKLTFSCNIMILFSKYK